MKLLKRTKNKITNNKNMAHIDNYILLDQLIFLTLNINKIQAFYTQLFQISRLVVYQKFLQKIISF